VGRRQPGVGKRLAVAALSALHDQPTGKVMNGTVIDRGHVPASPAAGGNGIHDFLFHLWYPDHIEGQDLERTCVCHD